MKGVKKGQGETYAQRLQREREIWTVKVIAYTQQEILDAVSLALHEGFGFGEERLKKFKEAFDSKYAEIRDLEKDDDDKEGTYSLYVTEKALAEAWGKYYEPRERRYDFHIRLGEKDIKL